jgi:hypothetical protein
MAITHAKYKGAKLSLKIGATEYNMDLTKAVITNEAADDSDASFADLSNGGALNWNLEIEAFSDYGTGSLWSYIWDNAGDTGVAYLLVPYGNTTASASDPHWSGTLKVGPKPGNIGGTANETFKFEYTFELEGEPTKVTS